MDIPKITADFQCFVCRAIFTADEDRKQHLEKEDHGRLHEDEAMKIWKLPRNRKD